MTITRVLSKKKGEEDVSVGGLSISFFLLSWETNISIRKLLTASGFPSLQFFFRHNVQCAGFIASFFFYPPPFFFCPRRQLFSNRRSVKGERGCSRRAPRSIIAFLPVLVVPIVEQSFIVPLSSRSCLGLESSKKGALSEEEFYLDGRDKLALAWCPKRMGGRGRPILATSWARGEAMKR